MKLVSIDQEGSSLAGLMDEAKHDRVVVEQNGEAIGVILSLEDYHCALGTPDSPEITTLLASAQVQTKLRRAEAAYAARKFLSHENVGERLRARLDTDG